MKKQHKDRTLIENWRLISLINVDVKIISKVIALRLKRVVPNIIHHNQTGYVEDRYIGETPINFRYNAWNLQTLRIFQVSLFSLTLKRLSTL